MIHVRGMPIQANATLATVTISLALVRRGLHATAPIQQIARLGQGLPLTLVSTPNSGQGMFQFWGDLLLEPPRSPCATMLYSEMGKCRTALAKPRKQRRAISWQEQSRPRERTFEAPASCPESRYIEHGLGLFTVERPLGRFIGGLRGRTVASTEIVQSDLHGDHRPAAERLLQL